MSLVSHSREQESNSKPTAVKLSSDAASAYAAAASRRAPLPTRLTLITPLVVEVMADTAWSGTSFWHALRYLRARPELDPGDVTPPGV